MFTSVEKEFWLDAPPHIEWMQTIERSLKDMISKNKKLEDIYLNVLKSRNVSVLRPQSLEEAQLFFNLSLLFTLDNAQEVMICENSQGIIDNVTGCNGLKKNLKEKSEMPISFKLPFDEIIITAKNEDNKYCPFFLQAFSLDEDWIDPKDSSRHKVYCLKMMGKSKPFRSLDGLLSEHRAFTETLIIPSRLPRIYFPSYSDSICLNCKLATNTDIFDHLDSPVTTRGAKYCFKNMRTMDICKNMAHGINITYARYGVFNFLRLNEIVNKLYKSPKKIERIQERARELKGDSFSDTQKEEKGRHYIEIKDNRYTYVMPKETKESCGTHAKPVEHRRNSHERRLKNGKVITVRETIINKGEKKPIYIIKNI